MKLLAVHVSGKASETQTSQEKLHRCYRRFAENNHLTSVRISSQVMVCLYNFKAHRSLHSKCTALSFMHGIYINGCLYSGLCAARSALSSIVTINGYTKLSEHLFVSRYLKGIYNRHPPLPKYTSIWGISLVLDYYSSNETNDKSKFKGKLYLQ